jgi:hypothetical protein
VRWRAPIAGVNLSDGLRNLCTDSFAGYGVEFRDLYLRQMLLTVNSIGKNESIRTDQMKFWSIRFSGRA